MRVVGRELYDYIGVCGFSVDFQACVIVISVNGEVQVVYRVVFFFRYFKLQVFVSIIHMVYDRLFVCSILVKDD